MVAGMIVRADAACLMHRHRVMLAAFVSGIVRHAMPDINAMSSDRQK